MSTLASKLPAWSRGPLRRLKIAATTARYRGTSRSCPVCGNSSSRFRTSGIIPRPDAECAYCNALERHRFLWLYMTERTDLFDGKPKSMLHVAPEACLAPRFQQRVGEGYLTADLLEPAMVKMDITAIQYPEASFDVIYCSHVLEHVPDDKKAMREFCRVLKPDGWAIVLVPITADKTIEDPSVTDPAERLRLFGQEDHVRRYGPDYMDRLQEAGFKIEKTSVADLVSPDDAVRMGLSAASGDIFHCTK